MARIDDTYPSGKFLKATSGGCLSLPGEPYEWTGTIARLRTHTFDDGGKQRVIEWTEDAPVLGLNKTNWMTIASFTGKDDDDDWTGVRVECFVVPESGSRTGHAVRVRKPRTPAAPTPGGAVLGASGKARLEQALRDKNLLLGGLVTYLERVPGGAAARTNPIDRWPAAWGAEIKKWLDNPPADVVIQEDDIPF